jgi:NDP-sugar pyrophosphorylase family protein
LGSRLQSSAGAKPLAPVLGGRTLLELLLARFRAAGIAEITCALRAEQIPPARRAELPQASGLRYLFADTESSLHTLGELVRVMGPNAGPVLFAMADTVLLPDDFERFVAFCARLGAGESAVLVTSFVDDEKPLWVDVAGEWVTRFGAERGAFVTSGMYFLSPEAMEVALAELAKGTHKMRNFLSKLLDAGLPIKHFAVSKTIDVDHPSDLEKAAQFLSDQGRSS